MRKEIFCTASGVAAGIMTSLIGRWNNAIETLIIFMIVDYLSGLIVAGIFKSSTKTKNGALKSIVGWKGLCKKGMTLLFILIANRLDIVLGTAYIRDAVIIGFLVNELISITENAGLMGIPIPGVVKRAIEVLKEKGEKANEN